MDGRDFPGAARVIAAVLSDLTLGNKQNVKYLTVSYLRETTYLSARYLSFDRSAWRSRLRIPNNQQIERLQSRSTPFQAFESSCRTFARRVTRNLGTDLRIRSVHTMATFAERLTSFEVAHPATKKRTSSTKSAKTLQWPHESPSPAQVCMKDWFQPCC